MAAWVAPALGFLGTQIKAWFDDRRDYRQARNEMTANGLGSFGGGFIIVTWLAPMWLILFEVLFPGMFEGSASRFFTSLESAPDWYFGTVVSLSLFAFGADQLAKLPKAWGRK